MNSKVYSHVGLPNIGYSAFNLSYEKKFTGDMGLLYPIMVDDCIPGDLWQIGAQAVIRCQPLVAPILHQIDIYACYYFVPYRKMWETSSSDCWEAFITGGEDGSLAPTIPTWDPNNGVDNIAGGLWDYFGYPLGVETDGCDPLVFPRYAYNWIWNEFYRPEDLVSEVALTQTSLLRVAWQRDYFTSALADLQRGTAPSLPISGTSAAVFDDDVEIDGAASGAGGVNLQTTSGTNLFGATTLAAMEQNLRARKTATGTSTNKGLDDNSVDLSSATTVDITDLRLAVQIQRFLERSNRAGARYIEALYAHFKIAPRDDRLDKPEFIASVKFPLIVSEVLQTSETNTTPQGTLAGHAIAAVNKYIAKYRVKEHGLIMGLMFIRPKPAYSSEGVERQWNSAARGTRYGWPFPEFANLSEQEIYNGELFITDGVSATNIDIFGYQGRYNECRSKQDMVVGGMRSTFDYFHCARQLGALPTLNSTFLLCTPRDDAWAAPSEDQFMISWGNKIKCIRPLPIAAVPGLMDH